MEQLSNFTTLKVGGPARKIVHAHTEDELIEFVKAADNAGEKVLILGAGSNLLISDDGFAGTVIRVESKGSALDYDACSGGMIEVSVVCCCPRSLRRWSHGRPWSSPRPCLPPPSSPTSWESLQKPHQTRLDQLVIFDFIFISDYDKLTFVT